jgi:transposase
VHLQDINNLLNLQDVNVVKVYNVIDESVQITVEHQNYLQPCPCCGSSHVIRRGVSGYRKVRHLPIFELKTILLLPRVRLSCKNCFFSFTMQYSFVCGKSRYTNQYKEQVSDAAVGATVTNAARITKTPYSTAERMFKKYLDDITPKISNLVLSASKQTEKLVIGLDDFVIRKGHTYNTGIHDLRNETLLHIIPGRKLEDLREDTHKFPQIYEINPIAVVMDLAPYYHTFAKEIFPNAIRIADRFHVNGYALDALQNLRRRISVDLSPRCRTILKRHKYLLSKRNDQLTPDEKLLLTQLLNMSSALEIVYSWKEELIEWYDCCININQAEIVFDRWLNHGYSLNIPEVDTALITFKNWRQEIINYHACRFTNAAVEGRNNKIKALQRRHYFTRNRNYYDSRINLECNINILTS